MQCLDPDLLAGFVTGALSDREVAQLDEHVASCRECAALLASYDLGHEAWHWLRIDGVEG